MQEGQKGIEKAVELMMKHNNNQLLQETGGQLLASISTKQDLDLAIKSVLASDSDSQKSLNLLAQLGQVEHFRKEMVTKGIHNKMLLNLEENSGEGGNDNIMAASAVTLSRMLDA